MSRTSNFPFTNKVQGETQATYKLGLYSNYSVTDESSEACHLTNKTCALDSPENITLRAQNIQQVNTTLKVLYPTPVSAGVKYGIHYETVMSTIDDISGDRFDEPIVINIDIRHGKSSTWSANDAANVIECLQRAMSALFADSGKSRIPDLMRLSERPISD